MNIIKRNYHKGMSLLFDRVMNNPMKAIYHDMRTQRYYKSGK